MYYSIFYRNYRVRHNIFIKTYVARIPFVDPSSISVKDVLFSSTNRKNALHASGFHFNVLLYFVFYRAYQLITNSASSTSTVYSFFYHFTELLRSTCVTAALGLTDIRVRRMKTHLADCAFSAASPRCWNSLLPVIRFADSVDSFKAQLKTHLFAKTYPI